MIRNKFKRKLFFDFETRSEEDLISVGAHKYTEHPSTEVILISYAFDDEPVEVCEYVPDHVMEAIIDPTVLKIAHNVEFEICVCVNVLGLECNHEEFFDTAYQAAYFGLPRSLGFLANVLRVAPKGSNEDMLFFSKCIRPAQEAPKDEWFAKATPTLWNEPKDHPYKWEKTKLYSRGDTISHRAAYNRMGVLPMFECFTMHITLEMNFNGVPFDVDLARRIEEKKIVYTERAQRIALEKYGITNLRSTKQIHEALHVENIYLTSLNKNEIPADVTHEILDLREDATGAAFSKIAQAFNRLCRDNRIHGDFVGHGAHTGRWSARGVQMQNWVKIFDSVSEKLEVVDSYNHLKQHLRLTLGHLKGWDFVNGDLSQIEARLVAYLADCKWRNEAFKNGIDIYSTSAEKLFGKPAPKGSTERAYGKVYELLLGFGGGWQAVQRGNPEFFKKQGAAKVMEDVKRWRYANPEIVKAWYKMSDAWLEAMRVGMYRLQCGPVTLVFQYDGSCMRITLPSGRALHYRGAHIQPDEYGRDQIYYHEYSERKEHSVLIKLWGGPIFENVVQAIARDVIVDIMRRIKERAPELMVIIGTVHDELWYLSRAGEKALSIMLEEMSIAPTWSPRLCIKGEGEYSDRYRKAA